MKKYCEECKREVETNIITQKESYIVCGEEIEVLDNKTLLAAYNKYRKKHKLLLPEEIKKIREQYGLSQRAFAKLLNWGDKTICRYENGSIQDKAHNSLLLFLREPKNMRVFLNENEILLDERQKKKLYNAVGELENKTKINDESNLIDLYFLNTPCAENGFKVFDYEKTCAMVLFFAHKNTDLLKTKLMKLLNYSDMIYYKENGISMSGLRYAHHKYGPVPENFDILLGKMAADHIAHIEVLYDNGYEKHQVVPDSNIPVGMITDDELNVLKKIYEKFKDFGSVEISNYSHKEKGYCETKQGEIISYIYAKEIELN